MIGKPAAWVKPPRQAGPPDLASSPTSCWVYLLGVWGSGRPPVLGAGTTQVRILSPRPLLMRPSSSGKDPWLPTRGRRFKSGRPLHFSTPRRDPACPAGWTSLGRCRDLVVQGPVERLAMPPKLNGMSRGLLSREEQVRGLSGAPFIAGAAPKEVRVAHNHENTGRTRSGRTSPARNQPS